MENYEENKDKKIETENNINISKENNKNIMENASTPFLKNNTQSLKTIAGTITQEYINDYIFTREFYKYNNTLKIKDTDDFSYKKQKVKKYREQLKKTRELHNDPKSSDFAGPWAKYKDEINFEEEKEQNKINIKTEEDPENILDMIKNNDSDNENKKKKKKKR